MATEDGLRRAARLAAQAHVHSALRPPCPDTEHPYEYPLPSAAGTGEHAFAPSVSPARPKGVDGDDSTGGAKRSGELMRRNHTEGTSLNLLDSPDQSAPPSGGMRRNASSNTLSELRM